MRCKTIPIARPGASRLPNPGTIAITCFRLRTNRCGVVEWRYALRALFVVEDRGA